MEIEKKLREVMREEIKDPRNVGAMAMIAIKKSKSEGCIDEVQLKKLVDKMSQLFTGYQNAVVMAALWFYTTEVVRTLFGLDEPTGKEN